MKLVGVCSMTCGAVSFILFATRLIDPAITVQQAIAGMGGMILIGLGAIILK